MKRLITTLFVFVSLGLNSYANNASLEMLKGKKILYTQRDQYLKDHHNSETLFQVGEINTAKFRGGSAMKIYDADTQESKTILESKDGIIRDPDLSYDAKKILFSMRKNKDDFYHIYEIDIDGKNLKQLTFAKNISDTDPVYLPNGDIVFSSTRHVKYCMCNRHIMANLFRMGGDGSNIYQISVNTLFDSHASVMSDGRILYERWEYVDRNFGDAQGLWTVNPDGTRHAIYYGNNTASPGGVIDAQQIPNTDLVVAILSSCHDRPWGSLAVIDRSKGVDGEDSIIDLVPESSRAFLKSKAVFSYDVFKASEFMVEDPFPLDRNNFLVSITLRPNTPVPPLASEGDVVATPKKAAAKAGAPKTTRIKDVNGKADIYLINTDGSKLRLFTQEQSIFDPIIIQKRPLPKIIPDVRDDDKDTGIFYVQDVYEGTHMKGVKRGDAKYIRVIETPEKRTWAINAWTGQGAQAPGVNFDGFENKRIIGEAKIEDDGSVSFEAPSNKFLYFQLLDENKKMIQSMRSGTMLMPGETYGCIGCHEDRLMAPMMDSSQTTALKKAPQKLEKWLGRDIKTFSYMENVQGILDKHCVECHDAGKDNKLVLSGDKNMFFNASYINLHVSKAVDVVGSGSAEVKPARSWGTSVSKLTKIIDSGHKDVKLSKEEKEIIYTWIDLNAPYYPTYETAFSAGLAGRSPLTNSETVELSKLSKIDFLKKRGLASFARNAPAQIYFERPQLSPALQSIKNNKAAFDRAVEIIKIGNERLKATPRGDILEEMHTLDSLVQKQLDNHNARKAEMERFKKAIQNGEKIYDLKE